MNRKSLLRSYLLVSLYLLPSSALLANAQESPKHRKAQSSTLLKELAQDSSAKNGTVTEVTTTITVTIQAGQTLEQLAKEYYRHPSYSGLLILFNQIKDQNRIAIGTKIQIPSFRTFLQKAGLFSVLDTEIEKFLKAQSLYRQEEEGLALLHAPLEIKATKGQVTLPKKMEKNLRKAADLVTQVAEGIEGKKAQFQSVPEKTIGQLKQLAVELNQLALGQADGHGSDRYLVQQRFAWIMKYLQIWAQKENLASEEEIATNKSVIEKVVEKKGGKEKVPPDPVSSPTNTTSPKVSSPVIVLTGTKAQLLLGKKPVVITKNEVEKLQKNLLAWVKSSSLSDKKELILELDHAPFGIDTQGVVRIGSWVLGTQGNRLILTYRSALRLGLYQFYVAELNRSDWTVENIYLQTIAQKPE